VTDVYGRVLSSVLPALDFTSLRSARDGVSAIQLMIPVTSLTTLREVQRYATTRACESDDRSARVFGGQSP